MSNAFLHTPVPATESAIRGLVGQREHMFLEIKEAAEGGSRSLRWKRRLSRNVAALMNSHGGDIVYGLRTESESGSGYDRIVGVSTLFHADQISDQAVRMALESRLVPKWVVDGLEISRVDFSEDGEPVTCMVISVPPYPHGMVATRKLEQSAGEQYFGFPVRSDDRTFYASLEVVVASIAQSNRAKHLALRRARDAGHPLFVSNFLVKFRDWIPVAIDPGAPRARLLEVYGDHIRVMMPADLTTAIVKVAYDELRRRDAPPAGRVKISDAPYRGLDAVLHGPRLPISSNSCFSIPLALVQAVWTDEYSGEAYTQLALSSPLRLSGSSYFLG